MALSDEALRKAAQLLDAGKEKVKKDGQGKRSQALETAFKEAWEAQKGGRYDAYASAMESALKIYEAEK